MKAQDLSIGVPKFEQATRPGIVLDTPPPARFSGVALEEMQTVRFRCPYCRVAHSAAILPNSPQIAKYHCRQCDHVIEIETRPSVMDSIEQECELRKDIGHVTDHPKEFSKNLARHHIEAALIAAKFR